MTPQVKIHTLQEGVTAKEFLGPEGERLGVVVQVESRVPTALTTIFLTPKGIVNFAKFLESLV